MRTKKTVKRNTLEEYIPGASRDQVLGALRRVASASKQNGKPAEKRPSIDEIVHKVAETAIELNREAIRELEKH